MSEEMRHPLDPTGMAAYESYRIVSDGRSLISGQPLPPWRELPGATREAWRAAADGAVMANALPPKWAPADWSAMLGQLHALAAKWEAEAGAVLTPGAAGDDPLGRPRQPSFAAGAVAGVLREHARQLRAALGQPS